MPAYISGTHHTTHDIEGVEYKVIQKEQAAYSKVSAVQLGHTLKNLEAIIFQKTMGNLAEAKKLVETNARYIPFIEYFIVFKDDEGDLYHSTVHAIYLDI